MDHLASRETILRDDGRLTYALPRGRGGGSEATGHVSGLRLGTIPISAHRGRAYTGQDLIAETSFTGPLALPYEIGGSRQPLKCASGVTSGEAGAGDAC